MWVNPLPESCVGLFITFCTEQILQKHIKTQMFAQQSQASPNYTDWLPFGSTNKKHKIMTTAILCKIYREILFQKVALGYLLHFVQNGSSKHILKQHVAQQSQTSQNYTARLPFGSATKTRKIMKTHILYKICREILFQKVALGYLLHFIQNGSSNKI